MNKIWLFGRLTKDPALSRTSGNIPVCRFTVASRSDYKNEDGEYDTDFFNCVAWREQAELINKLTKKGQQINLVGTMKSRRYTNKDGVEQLVWEFNVQNVWFINENKEQKNGEAPAELEEIEDSDDLPF